MNTYPCVSCRDITLATRAGLLKGCELSCCSIKERGVRDVRKLMNGKETYEIRIESLSKHDKL